MTDTRYTCFAPLELAATVLEDGSVEVESKVLDIGRKVQRGGAGEFEVTAQHLAEMVANHAADLANGYEPPALIGHPSKRDEAPAVGWVRGLRAAADGLYATVRFLGEFAARIKRGEYRYSSPSFAFSWHDETGVARGAKLLDLGILNTPFQKSLGAFALSEITHTQVGDDRGDTAMADANVELGELRIKNQHQADELKTLGESMTILTNERDDLTVRLSAAETECVALREQVATVQRASDAAELGSVLSVALGDGLLTPAQVKGHGTDGFDGLKWLSDSPFRDLAALKLFLSTAPRVVDLGDRQSSGSVDASDAATRDRVKRFAQTARIANPRLNEEQAMQIARGNA